MRITNALRIGWEWGFGNGGPSRDFAVLAAYHPVWSITWAWALYWSRGTTFRPRFWRHHNGGGWLLIPLLWAGALRLDWQDTMPRRDR